MKAGSLLETLNGKSKTELTMENIAMMHIYERLEQELYMIKLIKTQSFAVQSFQALVSISLKLPNKFNFIDDFLPQFSLQYLMVNSIIEQSSLS